MYVCVCKTSWPLLKTVKPAREQDVQVTERVAPGCVLWIFTKDCLSVLLCTGHRKSFPLQMERILSTGKYFSSQFSVVFAIYFFTTATV